jgi:hypothetical protein
VTFLNNKLRPCRDSRPDPSGEFVYAIALRAESATFTSTQCINPSPPAPDLIVTNAEAR